MYQGDVQPTHDVAAHPLVGLLTFHCKAAGYLFKHSLRLHSDESIHQHDKGREVTTLLEAGLHVIIIILLLCHLETLLRWLVLVIEGACVHDTHIVNTVSPSLWKVTDGKVSLLLRLFYSLWWIFGRVSHRMFLFLSNGITLMDDGVVAHVRGDEGFSWKVSDPITDLGVTSRDEAALILIYKLMEIVN